MWTIWFLKLLLVNQDVYQDSILHYVFKAKHYFKNGVLSNSKRDVAATVTPSIVYSSMHGSWMIMYERDDLHSPVEIKALKFS